MNKWLPLLALVLAFAAPAEAQVQRMLPANARLGEIVGRTQPFPLVQIDKKVLRLTAGALIFDENNRTILHQAIPEQAYILYAQDLAGDVTRIYILRPDELEAAKRRPAPETGPVVPGGVPVPLPTPVPAPAPKPGSPSPGPKPLPAP